MKTGGLGLSDFSRMAKCLRELGSRDEQAAGPAWDVGRKWVHKTWRRGDISGARVQLPKGATAFLCGYKSTQKGRPVSVRQAGHQCCNQQIFHSTPGSFLGRDAKPIPQENQLQGKGLVKPWGLSSHGLPDGKDLAQGVKLKDFLMQDPEHAKVPP